MKDQSPVQQTQQLVKQYLQMMRMRNSTDRSVKYVDDILRRFINWCDERGIESMDEVTHEIVAAYRRHLFHYRNARTGKPLKFDTQSHYLTPVRCWFRWMVQCDLIEHDPTQNVELPKSEERLPIDVLTADQMETLINRPDIKQPLGLRDRAILEVFYSCAIRSSELCNLDVYDIVEDRQIVNVRMGKGQKDRVVPIGERALSWTLKWLHDIRPDMVSHSVTHALFVSFRGHRLGPKHVSKIVRDYLTSTGIKQKGSCHLLRHTAATLMMENGADLRSLQQYLGHARLNTTQLYTHVSINRLREVHKATHPARPDGQSSGKTIGQVDGQTE